MATRAFIAANQTNTPAPPPPQKKRASYAARAAAAQNPTGARLLSGSCSKAPLTVRRLARGGSGCTGFLLCP